MSSRDEIIAWFQAWYEPDDTLSSPLGLARLYLESTSTSSPPCIVETHGIGHWDMDVFDSNPEAASAWEEVRKRLMITAEPEDGDFVIIENGDVITVMPTLEKFTSEEAAAEYIKWQMDRDQFWPDVWRQDDHGGFTLVTAELLGVPKTEPGG